MRFLLAFLCLASFSAAGQDSHYWYSEFNPAGFLMPGAVIANNGDSGVYFYNPALTALPNDQLSLSMPMCTNTNPSISKMGQVPAET